MNSDLTPLARATLAALNRLPLVSANGYRITNWTGVVSAMLEDNGHCYAVSEHYCAHCAIGRHCDNGTDGEGLCLHKLALRQAWNDATRQAAKERRFHEAIAADDERMRDYHEENADRYAVMAGAA